MAVTDDGATVIYLHAGDIVPGDTPDDDVTTDTDIDVFAATTSAAPLWLSETRNRCQRGSVNPRFPSARMPCGRQRY